jgi:hypothetical protein
MHQCNHISAKNAFDVTSDLPVPSLSAPDIILGMTRRRIIRIIAVTGFAATVSLGICSQFVGWGVHLFGFAFCTTHFGVLFAYYVLPVSWSPNPWPEHMQWARADLLPMPSYHWYATEVELFIPWWMFLPIIALLAAIVWRMTRPKPSPRTAFPVEQARS